MAVKLEKNYRPVVPVNSNLTVYFRSSASLTPKTSNSLLSINRYNCNRNVYQRLKYY